MTDTEQRIPHRHPGRRRDEYAKKRILQSALEILDEVGFANTSVQAIAERAGTGKATVYRWWPDKTAVVINALRQAIAQDLTCPHTGDLHRDVRGYLQNLSRSFRGHRARIFRSFLVAAQTNPEVAAAFQNMWCQPRREELKIALGRYRDCGLRDGVDFEVVLDVMHGALYNMLLVGPKSANAEYIYAVADIVLSGIASKRHAAGVSHSVPGPAR
ncbi:MAG: TetR/AcrR family transcriptional regulator [Acidobacteriaceae bacterium]|nr:TetR/AcrR family transcriptional regulator [Acidobacteriaceae bacterium]